MRGFLVLIGCLLASGTFAQAPKPQPPAAGAPAPAATPPISNVPQSTSASYGDWVLVCQREPEPSTVRLCEVSQSVQVQGQQQPIAQIAISKSKTPPAVNLTVVLPPNIILTAGPRVLIDEKDTQPVDLTWQRCLPGGCFANAALKDEVLAKWRPLNDRGRLEFRDAAGRTIVVPFSFRGLGAAYDALAKE